MQRENRSNIRSEDILPPIDTSEINKVIKAMKISEVTRGRKNNSRNRILEKWKKAILVPLHKKEEMFNLKNYSLICQIYKLLMKIIKTWLTTISSINRNSKTWYRLSSENNFYPNHIRARFD